jgi:hypothetical protein
MATKQLPYKPKTYTHRVTSYHPYTPKTYSPKTYAPRSRPGTWWIPQNGGHPHWVCKCTHDGGRVPNVIGTHIKQCGDCGLTQPPLTPEVILIFERLRS